MQTPCAILNKRKGWDRGDVVWWAAQCFCGQELGKWRIQQLALLHLFPQASTFPYPFSQHLSPPAPLFCVTLWSRCRFLGRLWDTSSLPPPLFLLLC